MQELKKQTAVIIGAGPAGLTAAYELAYRSTHIKPVVFESSEYLGGIARTENYKGNRIDIGGHRFFSKSDRILAWWQNILPLQKTDDQSFVINYQNKSTQINPSTQGPDPYATDKVLLVRNRLSRIFFEGKYYQYPITLNQQTLSNLGFLRMIKIGLSHLKARIFPRKEKSLEDFFINRFGRELYETFFKDYTEKVWGVPCSLISAQWGSQRVKGLSITKVLQHIFQKRFFPSPNLKQVEVSLIEKFLYPKLGPGQMWEEVGRLVQSKGGEIHLHHQVIGLTHRDGRIAQVKVRNTKTQEVLSVDCEYVFSTMPVKELVAAIRPEAPAEVQEVAQGLQYRDFITVGLLLTKLNTKEIALDNWIYIQDKRVKVGRLQIFNNWSPYLVKDPNTVWIGLEYFCNEGDALWDKNDEDLKRLAVDELVLIGIIRNEDVLDGKVVRSPKSYPSYIGKYSSFDVIRHFTDAIDNLFLIGRNGMHKYNNQDHSMLTAMTAVDNIMAGIKSKDNLWAINMEEDFHETK